MKGVLKITNVSQSKVKIEDFKIKYVYGRFKNEVSGIYEKLDKNNELIKKELMSQFNQVYIKAGRLQEKKLKGVIKYIYISYLRSNLFEGKAVYRIDLYDEKWFLDKEECSSFINFNFVFENLFIHMNELYEKKKEYGTGISELDIEKIMFEEGEGYHKVAVNLLNDLIEDLIKSDEYKKMSKDDEVMIFAGEFRDQSKLLLKT